MSMAETWTCTACDWDNNDSLPACEMCDTGRRRGGLPHEERLHLEEQEKQKQREMQMKQKQKQLLWEQQQRLEQQARQQLADERANIRKIIHEGITSPSGLVQRYAEHYVTPYFQFRNGDGSSTAYAFGARPPQSVD
eukprot:TRINITY_DN62275_c0_g1_i1.p2 TRINITY_DN62275_c0_g1~~TRINITY_DN62275_c0_g1_i1.p2  ORF type:complete len:137 (+),score=28.90 TRINITY_DN62275_c0_g1_i1:20-430(+)